MTIHPDIEALEAGTSPSSSEADEPTNQELEETRAFEAMVRFQPDSSRLKCGICDQPAKFLIPDGLSCDEHAWQAAARLDWETSDPWVPIRIDRSNA